MQAGMITNDELNRVLVNRLPHGVRLHAIIDACHSGSVRCCCCLSPACKPTSDCGTDTLGAAGYGPGISLQVRRLAYAGIVIQIFA